MQITLQQIILSGFSDNLARKQPLFDKNGNQIPHTPKSKALYESLNSEENLSIHPLSGLVKEKPEFVVYTDIFGVHEKVYMKGVTKVDSLMWLHNMGSKALVSY